MTLSRQKIFDKAVKGIVDQGQISVNEYGCCYLTSNGSKCAIGQLLPDDVAAKWDRWSEGTCSPGLASLILNHRKEVDEDLTEAGVELDYPFLKELQVLHDAATSIPNFIENAKSFAKLFDLQLNLPPED